MPWNAWESLEQNAAASLDDHQVGLEGRGKVKQEGEEEREKEEERKVEGERRKFQSQMIKQ